MLPKITLNGVPGFILHNDEDLNESSQDERREKEKEAIVNMRF